VQLVTGKGCVGLYAMQNVVGDSPGWRNGHVEITAYIRDEKKDDLLPSW
jgi:hypothetical protein